MRRLRYSTARFALIIAFLCAQKAFCSDLSRHYIAQYKNLAVQEQRLTGIPASIKLAMAVLESNSGQSYLAVKGNNHFGIKWWNVANDGAAFIETFDDDKDRRGKPIVSRFVKFNSAEASYRKHSDVLRRPRYAVLFTYLITDYRSWAYGLETCGYATAKGYGARLIELIERYQLTQYDALLPIADGDALGEQLVQLDADLQLAAVDSQLDAQSDARSDAQIEHQSQLDTQFDEPKAKNPSKGTPQYKTDFRQIKAVSTPQKRVLPPKNPIIESHFRNADGQLMHFTLTEVGEEEPPKK